MDFYNRESELEELDTLYEQSKKQAKMTVITGRRRMGKTLLSLHFSENKKTLYLFIAKKSEALLCEEFLEEINAHFEIPTIGKITSFADIFRLLLEIGKKEHFSVIIDEFQEFYNINSSIYSDIQKLWDLNKSSKVNLLFIGSVYSLIHKIFEDQKEPLFGRADRILQLKAFKISTLIHILDDNEISVQDSLFDYYAITGGTPKYIDLLVTNQAHNYDEVINFILKQNSPFLEEGKHLLIEEFGKEYSIYFSILQLIASGKISRNKIESILEKNIGGHIERLLTDYSIIEKIKPIDAKDNTKLQKYKIIDNFIAFWFRFIYKHYSAIENENFEYVKDIINRDYPTYCGKLLEKFYHELFWSTKKYNRIGSHWEKGSVNELDLVAFNDLEKKCVIADIKLNKNKIDIPKLKKNAEKFTEKYRDYNIEWIGLSLDSISQYLSFS